MNVNIKLLFLSFLFINFSLTSLQFAKAEEVFNPRIQENIGNPNTAIRLQDVVQFKISKIENKEGSKVTVQLSTKSDFKIYEDKLKFNYIPSNSLTYPINYSPTRPAETYFDPFYKKQKNVFKNGAEFILQNKNPIHEGDKLEIEVQSCSLSVCLVPAKLSLFISKGEESKESKTSTLFSNKDIKENQPNLLNSDNLESNPIEPNSVENKENITQTPEFEPSEKITMLNDSIAIKIQDALKAGSWLLFPALFIAGLLMNLTPCVYPMIPITLNVMTQFGEKGKAKRKLKSLPFIYVGGMVVTYSLLGVFAGMSGNIFGSQLANPIFNWIIAIVMFLLGLSMLGLFNFTAVQSFANKIPLAQNYPRTAVATMGAVSGLISAPCTGPVLSTILLLIAQNKNPVSGFTYMLFFALGFGLPYIALGFFGQRLSKLPKFPRLVNFIKIFFAALMFALALYYVRSLFQKIPYIQEIFTKPQALSISIFVMLAVTFTLLSTKKDLSGKISKIGLTMSCCILALWLTLASTNSFYQPKEISSLGDQNDKSLIQWKSNFDDAIILSKKTGKPIIFDIWAEWCSACLEMKETTWKDPKLIDYLNKNFIPVKLDYTDLPEDIQLLVNRWEINGLPAVGYFKANSDLKGKPDILFQGFATANKLLNASKNIQNKN
jgi:thioredoxin:protein disulfide reductase